MEIFCRIHKQNWNSTLPSLKLRGCANSDQCDLNWCCCVKLLDMVAHKCKTQHTYRKTQHTNQKHNKHIENTNHLSQNITHIEITTHTPKTQNTYLKTQHTSKTQWYVCCVLLLWATVAWDLRKQNFARMKKFLFLRLKSFSSVPTCSTDSDNLKKIQPY